jgi:p-hydroxybenzoate 3-monooxygenase
VRFSSQSGQTIEEGPILEKGITGMRSYVAEPLQYGTLYLVGDAGHIVPPTGAKGLNLAVADVRVLSDALIAWFSKGRRDLLESYSKTVLRRIWRAQDFSSWMTSLLHRFPEDTSGFQGRLQRAQLAYVTSSHAAATTLAENYVGLERV